MRSLSSCTHLRDGLHEISITKHLGLDCEMVGVGPEGIQSALARVVIVNSYGNVIYDQFCLTKERVTDYRTKVSGIRPEHLVEGETTPRSIF